MTRAEKPLYTPVNTTAAYCLRWSLSVFWKTSAPPAATWWPDFQSSGSGAGIRLWQHFRKSDRASQFLLSSTPTVSPAGIIRQVKGRLQTQIRSILPDAFQRNYHMISLGKARSVVIERYVGTQLNHHRMASPAQQLKLRHYQYINPEVTLPVRKRSGHGLYSYNLHLVVVNHGHQPDLSENNVSRKLQAIATLSREQNHLLCQVGVFADHIHLTLAPHVSESPAEIALNYMNYLAQAFEQRIPFEFGYYVGTFGGYDLGAVYNRVNA